MLTHLRILLAISTICLLTSMLSAQDLAPRAYIVIPVHSNAVNLTYSYYNGNVIFDGAVPITDGKAYINLSVISLTHSLNFFGRSANFLVSLPYGVGNFSGTVKEAEGNAYRSGMLDSGIRFSVNVKGGPAMDAREYSKWKQKTLIGVSLKVTMPTGQYNSSKLLNYGANRWSFKPEVGLSRRWGHWVVDTYAGVWFFTTNQKFFSENQFSPGVNTQSESPVGAFEGHLSYDVKPRLWMSFDANFWVGGTTSLNGKENSLTQQKNSRLGGTVSVPIGKHQALKFSFSDGAYISYGGNYKNVSMGWQYSWLGRPN
jgi:hypothetical protein